jgi:hypothetical protein
MGWFKDLTGIDTPSAIEDIGSDITEEWDRAVTKSGLNKAVPLMFPTFDTQENLETYELYEPALMAAGAYMGAQALPGLLGAEAAGGTAAGTTGGTMAGSDIVSGIMEYGPSIYGAIVGADAGDDAAAAARYAADLEAAYQREALDYLKAKEAVPRGISEGALKGLAGIYGLPGGTGTQQEMIEKAIASPLYKSIIGGREAGEEAILRSAAATGGLRSGDVQSNLYDYNVQLENKALLDAYNQQLSGLAGLTGYTSMAPAIASATSGIGRTLASGHIAGAQAEQFGQQQFIEALQGLGALGVESGIGQGMFSDRRLKSNIKKIGEIDGHNWYAWTWNIVAEKMGLKGDTIGVMADEVYDKQPEAVSLRNNFMFVDYASLEAI